MLILVIKISIENIGSVLTRRDARTSSVGVTIDNVKRTGSECQTLTADVERCSCTNPPNRTPREQQKNRADIFISAHAYRHFNILPNPEQDLQDYHDLEQDLQDYQDYQD